MMRGERGGMDSRGEGDGRARGGMGQARGTRVRFEP